MGLRAYVIILLILYACSFMESVMSTHIADRIYQRMLRYEHHQENYQSSLQYSINPFGLQLKKLAQIETISEDFPTKWSNMLYDAEWKLVNLLLDETKVMHKKMENDFDEVLRTSYPHNYTDMKNETIGCNITLKITLSERRKKKWRKFKRKERAVKSQIHSTKVSDFVELALQRSKFSNVTDNRKERKKERIGLQKEKIQLDQLVNSESEKENISKTRLVGQRHSLNSDVVSQSNGEKHHFA